MYILKFLDDNPLRVIIFLIIMILNLGNKFDNLIFEKGFFDLPPKSSSGRKSRFFLHRIFKRYLRGILIKLKLQNLLIDSGIDTKWFKEFATYWNKEFEGRPLKLPDFHFLHGSYRIKFQDNETPESPSINQFLESYQNNNCIYMLFGAVRKYAYEPFSGFKVEKYLKHNDTFLEYGCGYAPVSEFITKYSNKINIKILIADINQINSHFARWRLPKSVSFIPIQPFSDVNLKPETVDCISLITVMEHLPDPINVVQNLTSILKSGGVFIFDYILGDGDGQDTIESVNQRPEVLDFIRKNYILIEGEFLENESMGTTVCRKK